MRFKWKASVTVTALITAIILLILALSLINMTYYIMQNSQRDLERNRGRWFLEGRVQEYFDDLISGRRALESGHFTFKEKLQGQEQNFVLDIQKKNENRYVLNASMNWKNQMKIFQSCEYYSLKLFDYALFYNGDVDINLHQRMTVMGNIGARGALNVSPDLMYCYSKEFPFRIEYNTVKPAIKTILFTNDLDKWENRSNEKPLLQDPKTVDSSVFEQNKGLGELKLADFQSIWNAFYLYRDPTWVINDYVFFDKEMILNPYSSDKEMISFGNGYSTRFDFHDKRTEFVYIKKTASSLRYQNIDSLAYAYYYGKNKNAYFSTNNGKLTLTASEAPIMISLPDDAYDKTGIFPLGGGNWSFISKDERVSDVYMDSLEAMNHMILNVDYEYYPMDRQIKMLGNSYYQKHLYSLGLGDGSKTAFVGPQNPGRSEWRFKVLIDKFKANAYSMDRGMVFFEKPPELGKLIEAFVYPLFYLQKEPPGEDCGIFVDVYEKTAVLDLSKIYNYPKNGVIISYLPLLVKGKSSYPLAIVSPQNIYIENINPGGEGQPVFVISGKGVWLYKKKDQNRCFVNKCLIYSPLNSLTTVYENLDQNHNPDMFYGSAIFTMENTNSAMDISPKEQNFIYYPGIKNYLNTKPFSIFPMPFYINWLQRN